MKERIALENIIRAVRKVEPTSSEVYEEVGGTFMSGFDYAKSLIIELIDKELQELIFSDINNFFKDLKDE